MSVDKDPEVYKFLIGAVMALLGVLHFYGMSILKEIKKNIDKLFVKTDRMNERITRCEEHYKIDEVKK